jgi:hypothetical protein
VKSTVGSLYAREDKKKGIFGYKRLRVPVNKASLFKFHVVECSTQDSGARRGCSCSVSSNPPPHVSEPAAMVRRRLRRRPGVRSWGWRAPISTDTSSQTHTDRSLACPLLTLSSARPFSNCIFRSNGAPASLPPASCSLTHARRMDGFCNQNADQLGSLAGPSLLTVYVGVVEYASASLPPSSSSLTHAHRMDGFCNQNADQLGYLAGKSLLTVYVGVVECASASLSPASCSLTHARRMDGFCNQNADQLGYFAGPSLLDHTSLGSSYLITHVLHYPPPPTRTTLY